MYHNLLYRTERVSELSSTSDSPPQLLATQSYVSYTIL